MKDQTALIAGATGLVGRELLRHILASDYYASIKVLSRRPLHISDPRLQTLVVEDFDHLDTHSKEMQARDIYCLLGTTMKKAGSKQAFEKIDLEYPRKLAEIGKASPAFGQFLVVTAVGSNANSPLFYNRVKGRLEKELGAMDLRALKIFRPSLLLGHREETRIGERFAVALSNFLSFFMVGRKRGLFSIHASDVAKAMLVVARKNEPGRQVFGSAEMFKLAKSAVV